MPVLVIAAILILLFVVYRLVTAGRNPAWYADPAQDQLVSLFIADATGTDPSGLVNFICNQPWDAKELRNRIVHALNKVRLIADPVVFDRAKQTGKRISLESYRLG
jgi:hypothetical protein